MQDEAHMRSALALARRGLGNTWPNPSVGCVLVRGGRVVGRGRTGDGGRPHAETAALLQAGVEAKGATAYVTLEPCSHHGRTPPCADALVAAGVARVVAATGDPDPRVDGRGLQRLRDAGVAVTEGLLRAEAAELHAGFAKRVTEGRPLLTLKLATTLDGRIATRGGESKWITSSQARRAAHALRGRHDAVLVGIGTALADDPDLTCRIPGFRTRPIVRVVLDSGLRLPLAGRLARTANKAPTWVLHAPDADRARHEALTAVGCKLLAVPRSGASLDAGAALRVLGREGLTRVLAEGGSEVAASVLRAGLADRIAWFHAPFLIGGDGTSAVASLGDAPLAELARYRRSRVEAHGADLLTELRSAA